MAIRIDGSTYSRRRKPYVEAMGTYSRMLSSPDDTRLLTETYEWPDEEPPTLIGDVFGDVQLCEVTYKDRGGVVDVHRHWLLYGKALKRVRADYRKMVAGPMKWYGSPLVLSKVKDPRVDDIGLYADLRRYAEVTVEYTKTMPLKVRFESFPSEKPHFRCEMWYRADGRLVKAEVRRWARSAERYRITFDGEGAHVRTLS